MKTTHDDGKDPRESVWHSHANEVDTVLHKGKYWVFETKRVTDDPNALDELLKEMKEAD